MTTLYLTSSENELFAALPDAIKEGWSVKVLDRICDERSEDLVMRYKTFNSDTGEIKRLVEDAQNAKSPEELEKVASTLNVEQLSYNDIVDLYFLLGTRVQSAMIRHLLTNAKEDDEVEAVMTISVIRKAQSASNTTYCSSARE
mgnify:CR=1 FL=1